MRVPSMALVLLVKVQPWITYRSCSEAQAEAGIITEGERYNKVIDIWTRVTDDVANELFKEMKKFEEEVYSKARKTNFVEKSYKANFDIADENFHYNVCLLDGEKYAGKVDILVGGSPCQAFSIMGYKRGLEDARGTLFYEYARLVKEIQPKTFIYENVQGL